MSYNIIFLLEEISMRIVLDNILPDIIPQKSFSESQL